MKKNSGGLTCCWEKKRFLGDGPPKPSTGILGRKRTVMSAWGGKVPESGEYSRAGKDTDVLRKATLTEGQGFTPENRFRKGDIRRKFPGKGDRVR